MAITVNELSEINLAVYPNSLAEAGETAFFLGWTPQGKRLGVVAPAGSEGLTAFAGEASALGEQALLVCPPTHGNAAALRAALPWLPRARWACAHLPAAAIGWGWRRRATFGQRALWVATSG